MGLSNFYSRTRIERNEITFIGKKEKAEFLDIVHHATLLERAQADAISFDTQRAMKQSLAVVNSGGNDIIDAFSNDSLTGEGEEKQENVAAMRTQNRFCDTKNKLFDKLCPNCNLKHRKGDCAAKESTCYNCNKKGHWKNACRGMKNKSAASVLAHLCSSRTNEKHGKLSKNYS